MTTENWQEFAEGHAHTFVPDKASRLLSLLAKRSRPGRNVVVSPELDAPLLDTPDPIEVNFLLDHLAKRGYVTDQGSDEYLVTVEGWEYLKPSPGGVPRRCFVAMAFDPSLNDAYEQGIEAAARDCGLEPVRVDRMQYNEKICDRIVVEIRFAEFLIADVTHQEAGVYLA